MMGAVVVDAGDELFELRGRVKRLERELMEERSRPWKLAVEHAPDYISIVFETARRGADCTLRVHDDGIGFALDETTDTSLGLRLAQRFTRKLGGQLDIRRGSERGTVCSLTAPGDKLLGGGDDGGGRAQ
jgi:two-component sensor histidine kinase